LPKTVGRLPLVCPRVVVLVLVLVLDLYLSTIFKYLYLYWYWYLEPKYWYLYLRHGYWYWYLRLKYWYLYWYLNEYWLQLWFAHPVHAIATPRILKYAYWQRARRFSTSTPAMKCVSVRCSAVMRLS